MDKVIMFELPVEDVERAKKFYKKAFRWEVEPWNGSFGVKTVEEDKNWVPKEKGAINGEMYARESPEDRPCVVVLVDSIARALTRIKTAGGTVVSGKESHEDWGWYARVRDTEGNLFGLWQHK